MPEPEHILDDHPFPQIFRNHRAAGLGVGMVIDRDGGRADAMACGFRPAAGDLLCGGRARMGTAGDADHQLDVTAGSGGLE